MYQNKLVVAIKHNGRVLREHGDLVKIPFGSEFSILVKNLDSRRAAVRISIDGDDVLGGNELILNANSETELKRFVKNGNMQSGNAFKFIERTQAIEDGPRGIRSDDGIVRVEYWFERPLTTVRNDWYDRYNRYDWEDRRFGGPYWKDIGTSYSTNNIADSSRRISKGNLFSSVPLNVAGTGDIVAQATFSAALNDVGITVPGSEVQQSFNTTSGIIKDVTSNVIVLRLVGKTEGDEVKQAVTVKTKPKCITCGKLNKATAKFCTECGTSLNLL